MDMMNNECCAILGAKNNLHNELNFFFINVRAPLFCENVSMVLKTKIIVELLFCFVFFFFCLVFYKPCYENDSRIRLVVG